MEKFIALALILGLAACSHKAQNEASQAADTIAADANATMGEAVNDTDAAAAKALGAGEATVDNATDAARGTAGQALKDAGNEIEE
ncbi:MAG: hypothetical protein ABI240_14405 [Sphingomonas sp.]